MSEVLATPFKKPECGDMHQLGGYKAQAHIRDVLGGLIDLQIVGTDPDVVGPQNGAYTPAAGNVNPDGTFMINIETDAAVYVVELADGTQFTITAAQSTAYLGQWYPARLLSVVSATGYYSVGY